MLVSNVHWSVEKTQELILFWLDWKVNDTSSSLSPGNRVQRHQLLCCFMTRVSLINALRLNTVFVISGKACGLL